MPGADTRFRVPGLVAMLIVAGCGGGGGPAEPAPEPNRPPVAAASIPPQTITAGEMASVSLSSAFSDPNGDALQYAATSSNTGVATVSVSGSSVTVAAIAAGSTSVSVTASDPGGLTATQAFAVTVERRPPAVRLATVSVSVAEGDVAVLQVAVDSVPENPVVVRYSLGADDDPETDDADEADFVDDGDGRVRIEAGASNASIEITISDDEDIEPTREVLLVTLQPAAGGEYSVEGTRSAAVLIDEGVCDRTPQVQDEIMSLAGTGDCTAVDNRHLALVEKLDFSVYGGFAGAPLTTLRAGDFDGLPAMTTLNLAENELAELPEGVFAGLSSLVRLWIAENELTRLPEGVFEDLSSLEFLRLNHNQLTELPENLFAGLTGLDSWLMLHENQLTELPAGIFAGLSGVEVLRLNGNRLTELPEGVFADLSSLTSLDLSDNHLAALPEGVFSDLSSLESLFLANNQLTDLPVGAFTGLPRLAELTVLNNPGAPFPLTLELERTDSNNLLAPSPARISVVVAEGAPFPVDVRLSIVGGGLSQDTVTIAAGDAASTEMTVTRTAGRQAPTGIRVSRLPPVPGYIRGIRLEAGEPLLLFASSSADASDGGRRGARRRREP